MAQTLYNNKKGQDADLANVTVSGTLAVTGATTFTGAIAETAGRAVTVISGDGAITIANSIVFLTKGSAAAITIAAPTDVTHDGIQIWVVTGTAAAHVITSGVDGFNAKGSSGTCTYTAAIGNAVLLIARNGHWYTAVKTGVTIA